MPKDLQFNPAGSAPGSADNLGTDSQAAAGAAGQDQVIGEQQANAQADEPKYLTQADLDAILNEREKRTRQSLGDKMEARINQAITALKAEGISVTPEQARTLIEGQESQQSPAAVQTQQPAQAAAQDAPQLDPVTRKAVKIIADSGTNLQDTDPEYASVNTETDDPEEFLNSVRAAVAAKQKRLEGAGSPARIPTLVNGAPSSRPAHADMSATDTLNLAFSNPKGR